MNDKPKIEEQMNNDNNVPLPVTIENNVPNEENKDIQKPIALPLPYSPNAQDSKDGFIEEEERKSKEEKRKKIIEDILSLLRRRLKKIWSTQLQKSYDDLEKQIEEKNPENYQSIQELKKIRNDLKQRQAKFEQRGNSTEIESAGQEPKDSKSEKGKRKKERERGNSTEIESAGQEPKDSESEKKNQVVGNVEDKVREEKVSSKDGSLINNQSNRGVSTEVFQSYDIPLNKGLYVSIDQNNQPNENESLLKEINNQIEKIKTLEQKMEHKDLISILKEMGIFLSDRRNKQSTSHDTFSRFWVDKLFFWTKDLQNFFANVAKDKRCERYMKSTNNFFGEYILKKGWPLDLLCCLRHILCHLGPKSQLYTAILHIKEELMKLIHILFIVVPDLQEYITQFCTEEAYLVNKILELQADFSHGDNCK